MWGGSALCHSVCSPGGRVTPAIIRHRSHEYSIAGNDLPRRYGEFPLEFASTPICDIDPYYADKKTFIVISKGGAISRYDIKVILKKHSFIPVCIFSDFLQRVPYICYHPFTRLEGKPCPMIVYCKRSVLTSGDPGSPSMCSPTPSSRSPSSAPSSSTAMSWWSQTRSKYTECDVLWLFGALNFY